ncbi:hypothetical protein OROGR_028301 [Orobanche gracilis]
MSRRLQRRVVSEAEEEVLDWIKPISKLALNAKVAKAVVEEGGISILVHLAWSSSIFVADRATGALWNLSYSENLKCVEAFGIKALVDLIYQWSRSTGGERVLEREVGVLANLAARALANFAYHEGANGHDSREAVDALVQLTRSRHECVRQESASACGIYLMEMEIEKQSWQLVELRLCVALTSSCSNALLNFRKRQLVLSESEKYSIAVVQGGGVAALIALARSDADGHLCSSSASKAARLFSAMALAYMFDGRAGIRMDEIVVDAGNSKSVDLDGHRKLAMKHLEAFVTTIYCPRLFDAVVESSGHDIVVQQITENARIAVLEN